LTVQAVGGDGEDGDGEEPDAPIIDDRENEGDTDATDVQRRKKQEEEVHCSARTYPHRI